jgi:hypothetical protein
MTPPATAAARAVHRPAPGSRRAAVRHPRRISGPAPGRTTAAAVAIPAPGIALPRQRPRPAAPPRRRPARKVAPGRSGGESRGIVLRAIDTFEGASAGAVLDRLIRGRLWIGLLAFALIGIVAMQLLVLELNTGIGRTLTHEARLQRENAQLGIEDSMYSSEARVEPLAVAAGMTFARSGAVHFVAASPSNLTSATEALSTAVQAPATGSAGSTATAGGEASASSGSASQSPGSIGEAASSSAGAGSSPTSSNPGTGGGSSEPSPTVGLGQGTPASSAGQTATTAPSEVSPAGSQTTGASAAPASGTAAGASGPGGGVQAGPRE